MWKILKWLGLIVLVLILAVLLIGWIWHQPLPKGEPSKEADELAQKMLDAIGKEAWDTTRFANWTFRHETDYFWDKERNMVEVKWDDIKVLLHTKTVSGKVYQNGTLLAEEAAKTFVDKAWASFCNDSFWLCAPMKVFDPGTSRSLVKLKDEREGLKITYEGGGVTPGDSYVWILDKNNIPESYKMWVSIIPIGGVEATWEDWNQTATGAKIAGKRILANRVEIPVTNIKTGMKLAEFGRNEDPFK